MQAYDEILSRMENAYFEACGSRPSDNADALLRLKAVATELLNISCYCDKAIKQMFYRTASGDYLDMHAEICGIERKRASRATGKVRFFISSPDEDDIAIPQGTICSVGDNAYIQFVTVEDTVIPSGATSAYANVEALGEGEEYNVGREAISVMVNPPARVEGVINESATKGGSHDESDSVLRRRISEAYSFIHNGIGKRYYLDRIINIDEVLDASLLYGTNKSVIVYCRTANGTVSSELTAKIKDMLGAVELFGGNVSVRAATARSVDFDIIVRGGIEADVRSAIQEYIDLLRIGEAASEGKCERIVAELCEANECEAHASRISLSSGQYFTLGEVRVHYYE